MTPLTPLTPFFKVEHIIKKKKYFFNGKNKIFFFNIYSNMKIYMSPVRCHF